jgi:predicted nucleotidyltransferase component of viral defense system
MGKIPLFTKEQQLIFNQVVKEKYLKDNFYFTGGTALSAFYFQHRYSQDLDFFSENKFDDRNILSLVRLWAKQVGFAFRAELKEVVYVFFLSFKNKQILKLDFGHYPYKRVGKGIISNGIQIDSLLDIAVNKLASVNQRSTVKDFVDLYYLLEKFTIWDLIEGARIKFNMELEPWILGGDLAYVVDTFKEMPKMIKPLSLTTLQNFFREKAKELGKRCVE